MALNVEVVRRLVEQDNVRLSEQRLCEQDLDLEARVGVWPSGSSLEASTGTPRPCRSFAGVGLGLPAVQLCELRLELGGAHAVLSEKSGFS